MPEPDPTVRRQELGEQLRILRESAELSLTEAGRRIDASASKLSRIETGRHTAPVEDITALLAVYGVTGSHRRELITLAREAEQRGWWQRDRPDYPERQRTLISLESRADHIVNFEGMLIPGLLQTGEYTRALMVESGLICEENMEAHMVTRLGRHSMLASERAPALTALIDELALRRLIGGPDVLRRQLDHLVEDASRTNINIRLVPNIGGHVGNIGSFCLMRPPNGPAVVYVENLSSNLFIEERQAVEVYEQAVRKLLSFALSAEESVWRIANMAQHFGREASSYAGHETWSSRLA